MERLALPTEPQLVAEEDNTRIGSESWLRSRDSALDLARAIMSLLPSTTV